MFRSQSASIFEIFFSNISHFIWVFFVFVCYVMSIRNVFCKFTVVISDWNYKKLKFLAHIEYPRIWRSDFRHRIGYCELQVKFVVSLIFWSKWSNVNFVIEYKKNNAKKINSFVGIFAVTWKWPANFTEVTNSLVI